jgi:DNA-binding Lrp family transcriptional regulator
MFCSQAEIGTAPIRNLASSMAETRKIGAYVLIKITPGKSRNITQQVSAIEGVKTAHPVTGIYDIIAYLEAADINSLTGTVRSRIQTIDGVVRTHTAIVGELVTTGE